MDRADGLMVSSVSGMNIKVGTGGCMINGAVGINKAETTLTIDAGGSSTRTDLVVARFDDSNEKRKIEVLVKKGNPGNPGLIKSSNVYEIQLAEIRVPINTSSITDSHITDTRLNNTVCGAVLPAIPTKQSTDVLWKQLRDSIDLVNSAIDKTIAGDLKTRVDNLESVSFSSEELTILRNAGVEV
ncbi:MAG: hypothetical protein Q4E28_05030 [Clostridia bacterium]|nr:hypothetical protein [Clostridia bacterium]